jgi:hypothetical protein
MCRSSITLQLKFEDLLKIPPDIYGKTWSNTSVERPKFEDSHFEDFKL